MILTQRSTNTINGDYCVENQTHITTNAITRDMYSFCIVWTRQSDVQSTASILTVYKRDSFVLKFEMRNINLGPKTQWFSRPERLKWNSQLEKKYFYA